MLSNLCGPSSLGRSPQSRAGARRPELEALEARALLDGAPTGPTAPAGPLHHFDVTLPDTAVAGAVQTVTISARDAAGNLVTDYTGSVRLESTDRGVKLPPDHTFTAAEQGSFSLQLKLATAGPQTLRVVGGAVTGQAQVTVVPGPAVSLAVALPPRLVVDQPATVTLRALDEQGNVATSYSGSVHVASGDPRMSLPGDRRFGPADNGTWTFTITPRTVGDFLFNANDQARPNIRGGGFLTIRYATDTQNYVQALYKQVLGRDADRGGLTYWSGLLDQGVPRPTIIGSLQRSEEYRVKTVTTLYQSLLDRDPDSGGRAYFVARMAEGLTLDGLMTTLIASDEYYRRRGADTKEGFLAAAFADVIGQQPDNATLAAEADRLGRGVPRAQIVRDIMLSNAGTEIVVRDNYSKVLGRAPDAGALDSLMAAQQRQGLTSEGVALTLLSSDEFFQRSR